MNGAIDALQAKAPASVVIGTAGHIDHGKTALIHALTGIDTDRLPEEKRRGITIDLGFAVMESQAADGSMLSISFIDVPGHARFVRTMLAGTGGIDAVLFAVSAEESVKPQTEEHLAICELLDVRHGITVLTKADTVSDERLRDVTAEVRSFLSDSFLRSAPLVAVSAHAGTGMRDLRETLVRLAKSLPRQRMDSVFRLPIDRTFSVKGFGTVVTGTVIAGAVASGDSLAIEPGSRVVKVRGIQVHGRTEQCVSTGSRAALNLTKIEASEIERGHTLVPANLLQATDCVDVELTVLKNAPELKHRTRVHFHAFASECIAAVTLYESAVIESGQTGLGRLRLKRPVVLLPGDRFVIRRESPAMTIGGGRVLDAYPLMQARKSRTATWLCNLRVASREEAIWLRIVRSGTTAISLRQLSAETGVQEAFLAKWIEPWIEDGRLHRLDNGWLLTQESLTEAQRAIQSALTRNNKGEDGTKRAELRGRIRLRQDVFDFALQRLERNSQLRVAGEMVMSFDAQAKSGRGQDAINAVRQAFERGGLAPPSPAEVGKQLGIGADEMRKLMTDLLRQQALVRLGSDDLCIAREPLVVLADKVRALRGQQIDVGAFKQLTGVSRKYAIPLLEYLDRERVTLKRGDHRLVL